MLALRGESGEEMGGWKAKAKEFVEAVVVEWLARRGGANIVQYSCQFGGVDGDINIAMSN